MIFQLSELLESQLVSIDCLTDNVVVLVSQPYYTWCVLQTAVLLHRMTSRYSKRLPWMNDRKHVDLWTGDYEDKTR